MTGDHYTADDALDARLRSGLQALVAEAPEPPPFPAEVAAGRRWPRPLALAAAAAALLLVVGVVAVMAARDDDRSPVSTSEQVDLAGTRWVLERAERDGAPLVLPDRAVELGFARCARSTSQCLTGLRVAGTVGCNHFGADVEIVGDRMRLRQPRSTLAGCPGGERRWEVAADQIFTTGPGPAIRWTAEDLTLTSGGVELTYRRAVAPTPDPDGLLQTRWALGEARSAAGADVTSGLGGLVASFLECPSACGSGIVFGVADECGGASWVVDLVGERVRIRRTVQSTDTCGTGGLRSFLAKLASDDPEVTLRDGVLRVAAPDGRALVFRPDERIGPFEWGEELDAGASGQWMYRLAWVDQGDRFSIGLDRRDPAGTTHGSRAGFGDSEGEVIDDPGPEGGVLDSTAVEDLGGAVYVYGVAPAAAAQVVATLPDGSEVALGLHPIDGAEVPAFGGIAPEAPTAVVARDADGEELDRYETR